MQIRTSSQPLNIRRIVLFAAGVAGVLLVMMILRQALNLTLPEGRGILFQEGYALTGTVDTPLVVIADRAQLAEGSTVNGDAALVSRNDTTAAGVVNGDLTLIGSDVILRGTVAGDVMLLGKHLVLGGQVDGDVIALGSDLTIAAEARINGIITNCAGTLTDYRPAATNLVSCDQMDALSGMFGVDGGPLLPPLQPGIGTILAALTLTGVTILGAVLFPRPVRAMRRAVSTRPLYSGMAGGMAALLWVGLVAGDVLVLAFVPPLGLGLALVLLLALLVLLTLSAAGWIALAFGLGDFLLRRLFRQAQPMLLAALFGSLLLFVVWHILLVLPMGGVLLTLALVGLSLLGLGAALVTGRNR